MSLLLKPAVTVAIIIFHIVCGFNSPESVIRHGKYIYVSSINGAPLEKNGLGYISKLSYKGKMVKKKFISGLNAPKGLAAKNNVLYVTDIDRVVSYSLPDGIKKAEYKIAGSIFLNDITITQSGIVYVTDMHAHKIFKIENGIVSTYTTKIKSPNGIVALRNGYLAVVQYRGGRLYQITPNGRIRSFYIGIEYADGIDISDKSIYVSSFVNGKIYKISGRNNIQVIYKGLTTPADISVDVKYGRILVPLMKKGCIKALRLK